MIWSWIILPLNHVIASSCSAKKSCFVFHCPRPSLRERICGACTDTSTAPGSSFGLVNSSSAWRIRPEASPFPRCLTRNWNGKLRMPIRQIISTGPRIRRVIIVHSAAQVITARKSGALAWSEARNAAYAPSAAAFSTSRPSHGKPAPLPENECAPAPNLEWFLAAGRKGGSCDWCR